MTKYKSHFGYSIKNRNGIFLLVIIILILQLFIWQDFFRVNHPYEIDKDLIALNRERDSTLETIKAKADTIYPFNPNYIDDYKGYMLGLNTKQIDRLLEYRSNGNWINSVEDFKKVTELNDSILNKISKSFKFPKWVNSRKIAPSMSDKSNFVFKDLNTASKTDLKAVYGIGDKLSQRIINYRKKWNGFLSPNELYFIYGLDSMVIERVLKKFKVLTPRKIKIINLNQATSNDLVTIPFIDYEIAYEIIEYKKLVDGYSSKIQLKKVKGFPKDKFDIIQLYLTID